MADKRMFSNAIVNSDVFLDMPLSTQALYFHLSMNADNEGFVGSPKKIQKMIGASDDDMRILLAKRYILGFESGIIVIKHWYINNNIRQDQAKKTTYIEERAMLMLDGKQAYTEQKAGKYQAKDNQLTVNKQRTNCELTVKQLPSIVEYSREEYSICENNNAHAHEDFLPSIPSIQEIKDYIKLKSYKIDSQRFYNYYSAKGWKLGNTPISNWQVLIDDWARKDFIGNRIQNEFPQRMEQANDGFGREVTDEEI